MDKVKSTSINTGNENLDKLRRVFPQFVKENKIDFDALKKFFQDQEMVAGEEKYGLNWAGKSNAFKLIRTPSVGTLTPQEKESKDWDKTENLFIEGDNLEVLKLLQKHYREKIKMIYIDPPYNTGKDFIYKDNYTENISDYYEKTGQSKNGIKMTTNPESAGRYHSDWLTMMYPRLFLARNLLKEDGVIFISIDDNEVANLRLIMDEIFGEENFVSITVRVSNSAKNNVNQISVTHEYTLVYIKNKEKSNKNWVVKKRNYKEFESYANRLLKKGLTFSEIEKELKELTKYPRFYEFDHFYYCDEQGVYQTDNPGGVTKGNIKSEIIHPKTGKKCTKPNGGWRYGEDEIRRLEKENRWHFGEDEITIPRVKRYLAECLDSKPNAINFFDSQTDAKELKKNKLFFDFPKPVEYIKFLLSMEGSKNDIYLDFFAGSGTTAHAVMELNAEDGGDRKWICVQLPEATDEDSEAYKAGYKNIAEIARERIRLAGKKIEKGDTGFKALSLSKSNYRQWNLLTDKDDEHKLIKQMKVFLEKPLVDGYDEKSVVYEILLKEGYNLNSKVTQDKNGNMKCWQVIDEGKRLLVTFEKKITKDQVESLKLFEEDTFVCLDSALDDTTKINIGRNLNVKVI